MPRLDRSFIVLLLAVCSAAIQPRPARALSYTITDLGVLPGGGWSTGYGLNAAGIAVGSGNVVAGTYHGAAWRAGRGKDLGTLPGQSNSTAHAINDANQIVGLSLGNTFGTYHAVMWSQGAGIRDLGNLPGTTSSEAEDVNGAGTVVGSSFVSYNEYRGFVWKNGVMTDVGSLGGRECAAYGINTSGQVVGGATTPAGAYHAFRWQNGVLTDLGMPSGWQLAQGLAISDNGIIAGFGTNAAGQGHGLVYVNGTWTDVPPIAGDSFCSAEDVNSAGYVVGFSHSGYLPGNTGPLDRHASRIARAGDTATRSDHAWVYVNGQQYDLQTLIPANSGWSLVSADAINEAGQIVGSGWSPSGAEHGFLLTPVP